LKIAHLCATHNIILKMLSKREVHDNHLFGILGSGEFLLLHGHEHLIRNNGLMGVGVEIPAGSLSE